MNNFDQLIKNAKVTRNKLAKTDELYWIEKDNKKYVLRIFKDKKHLNRCLQLYKKLGNKEFLPKLLASKKNKIIVEFIDGRECTKKDASSLAEKIGRICGIINKIKKIGDYTTEKNFAGYIKAMIKEEYISEKFAKKINDFRANLTKKIKLEITMDANDLYPKNFKVFNNKVYMVDIGAIKPLPKGLGIAKGFSRWFKTPEQQQKFLSGYGKENSLKFFTKDYKKLITLQFLMRRLGIRAIMKLNTNIRKDLRSLKELIK